MKVKDIMTKNVAYINPASTIVEAAQLMQKHNVGAIPVCEKEGVVGILTDRDIVLRTVAHGDNPGSTPVKDIMTSNVTTITPDSDASHASEMMSSKQIRRLPVVENNMLVGIVSIGDIATVNTGYMQEASQSLSDISKPSRPEKM